jgi:hypothetical protein
MEEIMSSFLDSTGLSRLASKITDYFAKKDGSYPNMTVGNVSSVADSRISADAVSGDRWYKVADTAFDDTYGTRSGSWLITFASSETNKANITSLLLNVSLRTQNATKPYYVYTNGFCSGKLTDNAFGAKVVSRGIMGSGRKVELWVKCGADGTYRCSVLTKELAGRNYLLSKTKQFNYYDYTGAGSAAPVTDESNNVYVYEPTIVYAPIGGKGSSSQPVYVSSSGEVTACTPADMTVGNVMNMEIGSSADDLNNHTNPNGGIRILHILNTNAANVANRPVSGGGEVEIVAAGGGNAHQVFYPSDNSGDVFHRYRLNTIWSAWAKQAKTYCGWPNNTTGLHELGVFSSTGSNDNDITARFKISYTPMVLSQSVDIDLSINARCAISGTSITSTNGGPVVAYMKGTRTDVNCFTKLIDGKLHVYVGLLTDSHSLTCRCIWSVDSFQMSFSAVNNGVTTRPADLVPATRYAVQAQSF